MSKKKRKNETPCTGDNVKDAVNAFVDHMRSLGYDTFYMVYGKSDVERAGAFIDGSDNDIITMVGSMTVAHAPMANIHNGVTELVEQAQRHYRINPALALSTMPKDENGIPLFNSPCDGVDEDDNDVPDEFEHFGYES